ncbi:MAG: hypothetical protein RLN88_10855 [Ekhidna sp.]|uniref:hypothetical protein n=1 Tax=Ekhidna sp. TaxID=2608089 RepID=UPI0032EFA5A4
MSVEPNHRIIPKWLEELQQRSWEPEILLSGIVLYGMFKVPDLLDGFLAYFKLNIFGNSQDIDNMVALFKMGIYWLITGLILHLICRGIWIGMVGLSYAFPKGIRHDRLNYHGRFQEKVGRTPSYEEIVIRLEKISSSLFSISFMLFMSLIGGYLFFLILVILPFTIAYLVFDMGFQGVYFDIFQVYVLIMVGLGLIALLDFISLGYFRRFKAFAKIYWPLHRVVSVLTLSRFYRPIYYGIVTNFNKWFLFAFLLFFALVSIFGAGSITDSTYSGDSFSQLELWENRRGFMSYSGNYNDQNEGRPSTRASIPSDIITGDVLRLFVVANITSEDVMQEFMPLDSLKEAHPDTTAAALKLMIAQSYFKIQLDDKPIDADSWLMHYNTHTRQRGYLVYLNIGELGEGTHWVKLTGPGGKYNYVYTEIPFYRDIAFDPVSRPMQNENKQEEPDFQPKPFGIRD